MPVSPRTLWYVGAAAAATTAVAGGALIFRGLKKRKQLPQVGGGAPEGGSGPGLPPIPPTPTPDPTDELGFQVAQPNLRLEICRQWKVGNYRPDWRPELYAIIRQETLRQIAERDTEWDTVEQLRVKAFLVARGTLGALCPDIELPRTIYDVEEMGKKHSFFWRELWEILYLSAYNNISGLGT